MNRYYAVRVGKKKGIYMSWVDCLKNIRGYKNAEFKQFDNEKDALSYLKYENTDSMCSKQLGQKIHIYTDGSCINNGKVNASAGIGIYFGKNDPRNLSAKFLNKPSNQRAELYAIIKAIQLLTLNEIKIGVIIHTDSMYSINCITKWYDGWRKNNWRTYKKKRVKNLSLIQKLHEMIHKHNIQLKHVYSHTHRNDTHSKGNNYADKLALRGALS